SSSSGSRSRPAPRRSSPRSPSARSRSSSCVSQERSRDPPRDPKGATMISVPAMRLRQFGVTLYQALLGAKDVDRFVRFEVLGYQTGTPSAASTKAKKGKGPRVNWELLEKRI